MYRRFMNMAFTAALLIAAVVTPSCRRPKSASLSWEINSIRIGFETPIGELEVLDGVPTKRHHRQAL